MSVMRVHKTSNFTVMSNHHFKEKDMSLKAKGLLSLMLSLPESWNYSVAGLVKLSKDGKDSVMSALQELEKFGYLTRQQLTNSKGQFAGIEYHIYEEPQQVIPVADNPISAKENAAKPNADNRQQLNTILIKDKENKSIKESNTKGEAALGESEAYEILLSIEDTDLADLYLQYIEWRNTTEAPLTKQGLKMLIKRCERLSEFNIATQKAMIETALIQGWKNVFAPKEEERKGVNDVLEEHGRILFGD